MPKKSWALLLAVSAVFAFSLFTSHLNAQRRPRAQRPSARRARTGQPVAARCDALRDLLIADARAALTDLGATIPADFDTRYRTQLRTYDTACAAFENDQLSCMETATNSIAGVGTCGVNAGRAFEARITPPMMASDLVGWHVHALMQSSEAITTEGRAQLVGTWVSSDREPRTFEVRPDGTVVWQETRSGAPVREEGTLNILSPYRFEARLPSMTVRLAFFVDGDRAIFSNQTATGGYPIAASGVTRMGFNGNYFLIENIASAPSCRGYGGRLEPLPVTCQWEGEGEARALVIQRAAMRSIETGSDFPAYPMRFVERRGHLIPAGDAMVWRRPAS